MDLEHIKLGMWGQTLIYLYFYADDIEQTKSV